MPSISQGLYRWIFHRGATLEDFADRLNHFWTVGLLLVLSCVISWHQGYNSPIQCWAPAEFTHSMTAYVNNLCWNSYIISYPRDIERARELYHARHNISMPTPFVVRNEPTVQFKDIDESDDVFIRILSKRTLYQWLPLILCFQALLFKLPNIIMYVLHGFTGTSFEKIAGLTSGFESMHLQERDILGRQIGRYFYSSCEMYNKWLLAVLWLVVKILYCVNIIIQMSLTDAFLKTTDPAFENSTSYGNVITGNIFENNASIWKMSPSFPRKVMCDFSIQQLANVHRYTVQCLLPANQFNELVYMFIWVWLLFVAIVTCISLSVWIILTLFPIFDKRYIMKAFSLSEDMDPNSMSPQQISKFCDFVGKDGIMALKLVAANSSEILVSKTVCTMWHLKMRGLAALPMTYHDPGTVTGSGEAGFKQGHPQQPSAPVAYQELYPSSEIKKME